MSRIRYFFTLSFADLDLNLAYALGVGEQFQIWLEDNRHRDSSVKVCPILDSFVDIDKHIIGPQYAGLVEIEQ